MADSASGLKICILKNLSDTRDWAHCFSITWRPSTGEIMDELLTKWEEMGYSFKPLSDLVEGGSGKGALGGGTGNGEGAQGQLLSHLKILRAVLALGRPVVHGQLLPCHLFKKCRHILHFLLKGFLIRDLGHVRMMICMISHRVPVGGQKPTGNASAQELKGYNAYFCGEGEEKVIYLTFDCGYENGNTEPILKRLLMGGLVLLAPVHIGQTPEKSRIPQLLSHLKILRAVLALGPPVVQRNRKR